MLWAAQVGDGTDLDQIKRYEAKPNSANCEKDYYFQQDGFPEMIYSSSTGVNWLKGDKECQQLRTRMMGLTMLVTGQIYVRLKWLCRPSLRRTRIEKLGQKSTQCAKLLEKQLHNQKTSVILRISRMWFPGCGIYYIFTFAWHKCALEDVRIMLKYFPLQSWHSEAGWNVATARGIKVLPAGWLKRELGSCVGIPSHWSRWLLSWTLIMKI